MWSKLFLIVGLICLSQGKPKPYFGGGCATSCGSSCPSPCGSLPNYWPGFGTSNLATTNLGSSGALTQFPSYTSNLMTFGGLPLNGLQTGNYANLPTNNLLQNAYTAGTTGHAFNLPTVQYSSNSLQPQHLTGGLSGYTSNLPAQYDNSLLQSTFTPQTTSQTLTLPTFSTGSASNILSTGHTYAPNYQTVAQPSAYQAVDHSQLGFSGQSSQLASLTQQVLPSQVVSTLPSHTQTVWPTASQTLTYDVSQLGTNYSPNTLSGTSIDSSVLQSLTQLVPASYAPSYDWSTSLVSSNIPKTIPVNYNQFTRPQNVGSTSNVVAVVPPKPNPTENIAQLRQTSSYSAGCTQCPVQQQSSAYTTGCTQCPVQQSNSLIGRHGG